MTDKERIAELERRVDELERREFQYYPPTFMPPQTRTDVSPLTIGITSTACGQEWLWIKPVDFGDGPIYCY